MTTQDAEIGGTRPSGARPRAAIILAAGKGVRMRSARPKVLHEVGGRAMLGHVLAAARAIDCERRALIVGHGAESVSAAARAMDPEIALAVQDPPRGTGHAAMQARSALEGVDGDVFILFGDVPLIRPETLERMAAARDGAGLVALGFETASPTGYGRLLLGADGRLERIVEDKDASEAERAVTLCNSGVFCVDGARLFGWLDRIGCANAQGEHYLTDLVEIARADGEICAVATCPADEVLGVNSRGQLAEVEALFQARRRREAMEQGATLTAPETVFFSHDTRLGADVTVEPNVVFAPGVTIADGARIRAFSHLEGCHVAGGGIVGPYARLRPGAEIGEGAHVGNFVEVKNARLGPGAKANHLTYLGDAEIGAGANIGAGTITCNYDGFAKHRTEIGARAFIGSNTALVAPVAVGAGAIIGAGSTITRDVPGDALAVARGEQIVRQGLAARIREAKSAK